MRKIINMWINSDFLWKYEFLVSVFALVSTTALIIFLAVCGEPT